MTAKRIYVAVSVESDDIRIEVAPAEDGLDVVVTEDDQEASVWLDRLDVLQLVDKLNRWLSGGAA